eukprot:TRINITY_DN28050_c0_g1_i1.p1 TRINITY_DN28050_c0_g1~~TRINITY_DN28050_c0_g1_i1.p1  ORF type:complete len:785 (+),score=294.60 TRINITY_DN28050_c0_g1_i1:3-2357(+)
MTMVERVEVIRKQVPAVISLLDPHYDDSEEDEPGRDDDTEQSEWRSNFDHLLKLNGEGHDDRLDDAEADAKVQEEVFPCLRGAGGASCDGKPESNPFYTPAGFLPHPRVKHHFLTLSCDGSTGMNINRNRRWLRVWSESLTALMIHVKDRDADLPGHEVQIAIYSQVYGKLEMLIRNHQGSGVAFRQQDIHGSIPEELYLTMTYGEFYTGTVTLKFASGHYITHNEGELFVTEMRNPTAKERYDASWLLITKAKYVEWKAAAPPLPANTVQLPPALTKEPNHGPVFDPATPEQPDCSKFHRGCCTPPRIPGFKQPTTGTAAFLGREAAKMDGGADAANIHLLIISSAKTYPKRGDLIRSWVTLESSQGTRVYSKVYISVDCRFRALYDPATNYERSDANVQWLLGPKGPPPVEFSSALQVRVMAATDHMMVQGGFDWYYMVDDDSYVFPDAALWVVSQVPAPETTPYMIGHSSEWAMKINLHGAMPFGGGGVFINRKAAEAWRMKFPETETILNVRKMLGSGRCSSAGGDGAVCRCMNWAMLDAAHPGAPSADIAKTPAYYINWRGMHQLDTSDGHFKEAPSWYNSACPDCPTYEDLISLWLLDVVSQTPTVTIHHLLGWNKGKVFPGLGGREISALLAAALSELPPLLWNRRLCGRANAQFTVCVNFGYSLQVFPGSVDPDTATTLLERRRVSSNDTNPVEALSFVRTMPVVQAMTCQMFYKQGGFYFYLPTEVSMRPSYLPDCTGYATSSINMAASPPAFTTTIDIKGMKKFEWRVDIDSLL